MQFNQMISGRGHSPVGFHWERHSQDVRKKYLFAITHCKLLLNKPTNVDVVKNK